MNFALTMDKMQNMYSVLGTMLNILYRLSFPIFIKLLGYLILFPYTTEKTDSHKVKLTFLESINIMLDFCHFTKSGFNYSNS